MDEWAVSERSLVCWADHKRPSAWCTRPSALHACLCGKHMPDVCVRVCVCVQRMCSVCVCVWCIAKGHWQGVLEEQWRGVGEMIE